MKRALRILYHLPIPDTIYAGRTIFFGYKHAFESLGHSFQTLTPSDSQQEKFLEYQPHIFMTSIGPLTLRYLDLKTFQSARLKGMKVFANTPFWNSPFSKMRINETQSLSKDVNWIKRIRSGRFADHFYNICEQGDPRMEGFVKATGYSVHTILLAADDKLIYPEFSKKFKADISYIGTYLPGKKKILDEQVRPLLKKYKTKIYGQDWTLIDRFLGIVQRGGQYFNIPFLRSFMKQPLQLEDERRIYTSSTISINIHEDYQKQFKGDINERTFKIPLAGGFEIIDSVPSLKKYFKLGRELIVAENKDDWFEKIAYYMRHPKERHAIIQAGMAAVQKKHTYKNRVNQIIKIYKNEE